jgi:hypothetical protein
MVICILGSTSHGLLPVRKGRPIAEKYLHGSPVDQPARLQPVTRSIPSAVGVKPGRWIRDREGNQNGHADLHLAGRDMARDQRQLELPADDN